MRNPPWQDGLFSVTYGNNTFVAVGNGGTIIQSDPVIAIDNPDISISPAAVNFGYVSVGSIASAQTFTVSNNGNSDLLIGTITFTSATFDFTKEYDHCSGQTISPLGACMLQTIFLPASNGAKSATLSIPSDDPDTSILNVPLRGHGVVKGDLDNDGNVTLADALLALQVLGGSTPPALRADYAYSGVDIDGDETVGLAEALFILQKIAGLRVLAGNCTDGSGGSGTPAEQAACYLALLAVPETRLSGWLGLYDALGVPVLQDGVPLGSTGDDPVGPHYWQVWYASGLDLPGRGGIPLSDAGRMLAVSISDAEASAYGPLLIDDLRLAAQSSDPQVQLLGLFVRGRILRGPSHLDILDPAVTAEKAVIDLPTIQLIGWIAMRGALFQDVSTIIAPAPLMAEGLQPAPKKRSGIPPIADLKCSDLSNDKTTWANWVIDKIGGGFQLPGMDKALLPSIVSRFQTKYLQDLVPVIETTNKVAAVLDVLTSAIGAGLQYLAMDYDYSQSPLPLVRNKVNNCNEGTCDGEPGKITVRVEYNLGKIPDGDSLYLCYISFVNNAIGVSISFPTQGPIPNTEIFIEAGERIPELVLFSSRGTYSRVTTDENGQAEINILGRNKQGLPATATPREEISSIIVSSQLEEEGTISMASMFFDAMSVPFGGGIPATLSSLIDLLKTLHWKPWEIFIVVRDWTTDDITPPTDVTDLTVTSVSPSQLKLSWSASTDDVGVTGYNIYRDGKYLKSTVGTSAVDTGLTASTQYCYQVTAFDAARNESFKYSRVCAKTKKEDETRPTVISTSPAAGAMNVARTSTILVTFSKAMDPATITRNALTVSNGKSVLFAFYHSATHTAEFTLSTSLASNTEYTATISASVMDEVGNAMESNYTWSFLTRADATLVSIAVTPANPSVDKGLTQQFTATVAYSDGTSQKLTSGIIWNSSNTAVATVNTFGLAVGIAGGTSTITATSGTISGSTTLVVIAEAPGVNWTLRSSPGYSLEGVVWSGTQFVAVGWDGDILTSPDGVTWTAQSSGTASYLYGVAWSGTQFVAVGSDGTILTSP